MIVVVASNEKEVIAVGEEVRIAIAPTWFGLRDPFGQAATLGHLEEGVGNVGGEDDHAARTPCRAAAFRCIAEHLNWSTGERYFLQLPRREETNVLAIRRPERKCRLLDLFHLAHRSRGDVSDSQLSLASISGPGQESELRTIRGKCRRSCRNKGEFHFAGRQPGCRHRPPCLFEPGAGG